MISKELLSLVLDEDDSIGKIVDIGSSDNMLFIRRELDGIIKKKDLNLDTLGRLMLDFIVKQGLVVEIWEDGEVIDIELLNNRKLLLDDGIIYTKESKRSERIEGIIKAAEWVKEQL